MTERGCSFKNSSSVLFGVLVDTHEVKGDVLLVADDPAVVRVRGNAKSHR